MKGECKIYKLGDVCDVINGLWTGKKEPFINICVIRNTNFTKDCKLNLDDVAYIDAEVKQFSTRKLQVGDIIVEKSGGSDKQPVGRVVLFDVGEGDYSFSNFTSALRVKGDIDPKYLHKCLLAHYRRGETEKLQSKTTGIRNLDMKGYLRLPIPIRPLPEQERIVAELDCLSDIIEKQKQQLKELDNLAQSIFYTTFGDPISNNFGWDVKKLGDVCTIERGGSPRPITDYITDAEDGVNWIKIGDASEGSMYINSVKEKIKPEGVKKSRKVYKGDFILSNSMSFGKPYILGVDGCIHDGWLVIRDNNNVFNKCYLYYYLSSDALYGEFKSLAVGGVVNNLNSNLVRGVKVCIPDMSLQHEFASKIEAIEKQKDMIKQSIEETETLFNSRMDYYFN